MLRRRCLNIATAYRGLSRGNARRAIAASACCLIHFAALARPEADRARRIEASAIQPLLHCRDITSQAERLACYDGQVDALAKATNAGDVVVVDRAQVQQARRSVFGLTLPSLSFLDRDSRDRPEILKEITTKIVRAAPDPYGKWTLTLEDGSRWTQIEPFEFATDPRSGMEVRIRRAAMGSYFANVAGQRAVRVERTR